MRNAIFTLAGATLLLALVAPASAIDVVVRRSTTSRDGGTISKMTKTEVTVTKQVGGDTVVPVNDIAWIEFDGAPASMGLGRSALEGGNLDVAQKQLETALQESAASTKAGLQGDLNYMLARVFALRAQANPALAAEASQRLSDFVSKNRDHYRAFDAQLLLGDVALATGDAGAATRSEEHTRSVRVERCWRSRTSTAPNASSTLWRPSHPRMTPRSPADCRHCWARRSA